MSRHRSYILFFLVSICGHLTSLAQTTKYFIEFTDKQNTPFSTSRPLEFLSQRAIDRRTRQNLSITSGDLPVNPEYLKAIRQAGATVWYSSRWMNGALIETDQAILTEVQKLPFVKTVTAQNRISKQARLGAQTGMKRESRKQNETINYGSSLAQNAMLGIDKMHVAGYTGKGIHIAIMDGGFFAANEMSVFKPIFDGQRLLGTHDFVRKQSGVFDKTLHGTQVWSALAGFGIGALVGPAYESSFWLFRTEDDASEYRIEEVNWLIAAEFADSVGVDIIQTSLGYTTFDDPAMNYSPAQMDGKTAFITRAAKLAASRGMLVVVSAGNEGNDPWRTISAPADADSVLAVAAVDRSQLRGSLSSVGKIIGQKTLKPNVAAQGVGTAVMNPPNTLSAANGTSFASPLIAGLAAGLWQAFPQLTNMQLLEYLQRAGHQAAKPDTLLGYGIPEFTRAYAIIQTDLDPKAPLGYLSPNPLNAEELTFRVSQTNLGQSILLEFFDLQGRKLLMQRIAEAQTENKLALPASIFRPGIYVVKASGDRAQVTLRLVKL